MPADIISAIEDGLLATLTAAVAGTKVRVDALPGDWDDDMLKRLLTLAPCVLVSFAGGAPLAVGATEPTIEGQWLVYAVTSHPNGQAARRRGNAQALGAYDLLARLIIPVLHGHRVDGAGTARLVRVDNLFTGAVERQGLAVYSAAFSLPVPFSIDTSASLATFATFAAQLDVPPFEAATEHAKWLAGDYSASNPDARDTVALPT